ncbi:MULTISPECIES: pyruvate kinase [Methylosinus]|uniref:Pyruvate kinase n=1 Tax=Methylosinus trichosporium (strain ATCC 35070 / NCIMB 11131 / UNIQEM 75 / OB3b) TaxID=595536 RepID=A0A2D2D643_METT3|nr:MULTISPECIES: pyruvate kinase [Methylosinus]ATQ70478.1 pyruvate kinase [Methylosinus trichosporium OB3b]OBS53034.1 pyruvate kinase [Methylosinus sp. 3S-1]
MTSPTATRNELEDLLRALRLLREEVVADAAAILHGWGEEVAGSGFAPAAENLAHYLALRRRDLSALQTRLAALGLSSLGRSEAKVLAALDAIIATLRRLCGEGDAPYPPPAAMRAGEEALLAARDLIFGPVPATPRAVVMVTLPSEAASDPGLLRRLMEAGMGCARINCAHDDADAWARMVAHIRAAETEMNRSCRVLMDIAGPKCRIERLRAPDKLRLFRGDRFALVTTLDPRTRGPVAALPSFPEVVDQLAPGAEVWINDGKIGARVVGRRPDGVELEVFVARAKGERLKLEKGLNFPTTDLRLPPLTPKDFADLDIVAELADLVGFSFVQEPADVELLQDHLAARRGERPRQALVLKIETPLAVRNLPRLITTSAAHHPTAVMIARGDLAVELGFARLSEMQEEILWLCEAAHVPVVWATQVLDQFIRDGAPSRAETTDAAMAQRAECVMLNKGPFLPEAVIFLRDVLARMDRHQSKKFARFTPLHAWG